MGLLRVSYLLGEMFKNLLVIGLTFGLSPTSMAPSIRYLYL